MKCRKCGSEEFYATQEVFHRVLISGENGENIEELGVSVYGDIYGYECAHCGEPFSEEKKSC